MAYSVAAAQPSDAYDIATIMLDSFKDDPIISQLWPNTDPEANHAWHVRYYTKAFGTVGRDGTHFLKVVDNESGKMVAFAKWQYPHTLSAEQQAEQEKVDQNKEPRPKGTNTELLKIFMDALDERRKKWIDEAEGYFLHLLCVSPSHQRRGLGSKLIEVGLAEADKHNAKTYIEASPKGLQLYLTHGWKQVDDIVIDMRLHGGDYVASEKCLLREPGGK